MIRYTHASDADFTELEHRCERGCVRFNNQQLPPGCTPAQGRIGFEHDAATDRWRLLVQRGITYRGGHRRIAAWIRNGQLEFADLAALKAFLRDDLRSEFQRFQDSEHAGDMPEQEPRPLTVDPSTLTDLGQVTAAASRVTGIFIDESALRDRLQEQVRGQDTAAATIANRITAQMARLHPRRPATMMFIGPTGVGKTRAAEVLPALLRDLTSDAADIGYVRIDMSEYQEAHRVSQLLGAPQGYVGYGDRSELLDALTRNPRTLVLFDEIEKAHPRVFQTLMNAMDAGRLSSAAGTQNGHTVDCRKAIFLFTSNFKSAEISTAVSEATAEPAAEQVNQICRQALRGAGIPAELIGRISSFVVFKPLSQAARKEIATQAIAVVAGEYGLQLQRIEPQVVSEILQASREESLGARPLEYQIDEQLGPAFRAAAAESASSPEDLLWLVHGPPFRCRAVSDGGSHERGESSRVAGATRCITITE